MDQALSAKLAAPAWLDPAKHGDPGVGCSCQRCWVALTARQAYQRAEEGEDPYWVESLPKGSAPVRESVYLEGENALVWVTANIQCTSVVWLTARTRVYGLHGVCFTARTEWSYNSMGSHKKHFCYFVHC
jgi:hypothetical protein